MTMFEFGPTVILEASTKRIWVCPVAKVAIRSLNRTSWPRTMRRGAPPGGVPVASGLTALSTPTRSAKAGELAPRHPRRAAVSMDGKRRRRMAVIERSLEADLRADQHRGVVIRIKRQVRRHDIACDLHHDRDPRRYRQGFGNPKAPALGQLAAGRE